MRRNLRSCLRRVHGVLLAMDDVIMDSVLHVRSLILEVIQELRIRFIFGEEQFGRAFGN